MYLSLTRNIAIFSKWIAASNIHSMYVLWIVSNSIPSESSRWSFAAGFKKKAWITTPSQIISRHFQIKSGSLETVLLRIQHRKCHIHVQFRMRNEQWQGSAPHKSTTEYREGEHHLFPVLIRQWIVLYITRHMYPRKMHCLDFFSFLQGLFTVDRSFSLLLGHRWCIHRLTILLLICSRSFCSISNVLTIAMRSIYGSWRTILNEIMLNLARFARK